METTQVETTTTESDEYVEESEAQSLVTPYRSWTPRPLRDPRSASIYDIGSDLTEIIEAEGPMLCHRAYRIYMEAAGIQNHQPQVFPDGA